MANVYYEKDADPSLIAGRKVAIIGYGSQGHAHALNLKDSGVDVRVGLREGSSSKAKAEAAGPRGACRSPRPPAEADLIMMLLPDTEQQGGLRGATSRRTCSDGDALFFAHGFNIRFGQITPPDGRRRGHGRAQGPGPPRAPHLHRGRRRAVPHRRRAGRHRARPRDLALSYADAIGGTRAGVLETTFEEETETDLFGEQVVLCGGLTVARAGRLRDARRGRLPARVGVLRVPARAEAHRRPHVRGGHRRHALLDLRHRRVRRRHPRARGSSPTTTKAEMKQILDEIQTASSPRSGSPRTEAGRANVQRAPRGRARSTRSRRSAPSCGR